MTGKIAFLSLLLIGLFSLNSNAQLKKSLGVLGDVTKLGLPEDKEQFSKDFLDALTPDTDMGLGADVLEKLNGKNKSFVDDVVGILGGGGSNDDMLEKIGLKKKEKDDFIQKFLGDGNAGKYYSSIKKKVDSFKTKYKVAKMFM